MAVSANAIKAGEAFVQLFADDTKFTQAIDRSRDKFIKFITLLRTAGTGGILKNLSFRGISDVITSGLRSISNALSGIGRLASIAGGSLTAAFAGAAYSAAKQGSELNRMSKEVGTSVEGLSRLAYAAGKTGIELDDVGDLLFTINTKIIDAQDGLEDAVWSFQKLGMTSRQFQSLNADEKFAAIAQAMEKIKDASDRNRFLKGFFDEDEIKRVTPLLGAGTDKLREFFKEADKVGAVVSTEDASKSAQALQTLNIVFDSIKSTIREVGMAVLTLGDDSGETLEIVLMYLKMARDWIKENKQLVATVVIGTVALTAIGGVILGVAAAISVLAGAISALVAVGSFIVGVIGALSIKIVVITAIIAALTAGVGYLIYRFFKFTEVGRQITEAVSRYFEQMFDRIKQVFGGIADALKKGDLTTAWELVTVGLEREWHILMMDLINMWYGFTSSMIGGFLKAVTIIRFAFVKVLSDIKLQILTAANFLAKTLQKTTIGFDNPILKALTTQLDNAAKEIDELFEKERKFNSELKLDDVAVGKEFMKKREEETIKQLQEKAEELGKLNDRIEGLTKKAAEPKKVEQAIPVAPMPRMKGGIDENIRKIGDSVRGLFDSSNFASALGIGEANKYAQRSLDVLQNIDGKLGVLIQQNNGNFFS